ncbi:hypothetical protein T06_16047 [Trichinella sp. T6]|nr:hypothetical protein T06_16047 [Trichinella sp. T6]
MAFKALVILVAYYLYNMRSVLADILVEFNSAFLLFLLHSGIYPHYKVKTKVKKSEDADDTNQITDRTKQNKR